METKHLLSIVAAALCLSFSSSCSKEDYTGQKVRFQCRTIPGAARTRTSYSGATYLENNTTYERIDWVQGDVIKVSREYDGEADITKEYTISGGTPNGRISTATLETDDGFVWAGTGDHYFWAAYPSESTTLSRSGTVFTVSRSVPAVQTQTYYRKADDVVYFNPEMKTALMIAGNKTRPGGSVLLDFHPAVTTFDFTAGVNGKSILKGFTMEISGESQSKLSGDVVATLDFDLPEGGRRFSVASPQVSDGKEISVIFGESGVSLDADTKLNFKVFAHPNEITGLRITFIFSDGTTQSLNLQSNTLEWIAFPPFVKADIKGLIIPGAEWKITFEGPLEEKWVEHTAVMDIGVDQ